MTQAAGKRKDVRKAKQVVGSVASAAVVRQRLGPQAYDVTARLMLLPASDSKLCCRRHMRHMRERACLLMLQARHMGDMRCIGLIDNELRTEALPVKPEMRTRIARI